MGICEDRRRDAVEQEQFLDGSGRACVWAVWRGIYRLRTGLLDALLI